MLAEEDMCQTFFWCYMPAGCLGENAWSQMELDTCVGDLIKLDIFLGYTESLHTFDTCENLYVEMKAH